MDSSSELSSKDTGFNIDLKLDGITFDKQDRVQEPTIFSPDYVYDKKLFAQESSAEHEPEYNWREDYKREQEKKGRVIVQYPAWGELHQAMREQLVFQHYIDMVREFALNETPEIWKYIENQAKDFIPNQKIPSLAETHEGYDYILLEPNILLNEAHSGDTNRFAAILAAIAHESKHLVLFTYKLKKKPLAEGMNPIVASDGAEGDMYREEICWHFHEGIYQNITGETPEITWKDKREYYEQKYNQPVPVA